MKIVWMLSMILFSTLQIQAQYRTYKHRYEVKEYKYQKTDPYNPTGACFLSIIPGLGHLYVGEPVKAIAFFGMMYTSLVATTFGVYQGYNRGDPTLVNLLVFGGAAGVLGTFIWSMADVTKVAKIKNLAFRDKNLSFHFYPSIQYRMIESANASNLLGATIAIQF